MFVILTQSVPELGQKNALVKVKNGYFQNYLFPRKLARIATKDSIEALKDIIAQQKLLEAELARAFLEHVKVLSGSVLKLASKASEKGTLFKALGERDVVSAIKKQFGIEIEKSHVEMEHFKKIGDYTVKLHMGAQHIPMKVHVEAKSHES